MAPSLASLARTPLTAVIYKHLVEDSRRGELRLLPTSMQ